MLITEMYRNILMIAVHFANKVSLFLHSGNFFCFSEELRYYRDFTESTFSKEKCPQNTQMKMKEPTPTF